MSRDSITALKPGQRFNRWTLIKHRGMNGKYRRWLCQCDCGTLRVLAVSMVTRERTKSCGCLQKERVAARATKHGKFESPEYASFIAMRQRCLNKNNSAYGHYGGRGITICERWSEFENFYADMSPRPKGHSLERIDNNGNYCPENCRWATQSDQLRNTRRNRYLDFNGERMVVVDWAKHFGVNVNAIYARIADGWTTEETFGIPFGMEANKVKRLRRTMRAQSS